VGEVVYIGVDQRVFIEGIRWHPGVFRVYIVSRTAQVELKSGRV
jgi:hypothetical protein